MGSYFCAFFVFSFLLFPLYPRLSYVGVVWNLLIINSYLVFMSGALQSPPASPFVSPRSTPVHMLRSRHSSGSALPVHLLPGKKELDPTVHLLPGKKELD